MAYRAKRKMPLSSRVDPDLLLSDAKESDRFTRKDPHMSSFAYSSRYQQADIPKYSIPEKSMEAKAAYSLVHDELNLDGRAELNCASFLTAWMEPEADALIKENMNKNFVDADGFPSSMIIHERCISMLSHMWNIPKGNHAIGTVCGGSSEGVMLGGLALKWGWREKRKTEGKDYSKPNVVLGSNAHCCIEKFARYHDVEARIVPVKKENSYVMNPKDCVEQCDENTIGVFSILGSTYTGHYEDVEALSKELDAFQERTGIDIPIHVDGASGGFMAPFATPDLKWGFDIKRVVSINTSGHKFGLVYAGLGWVVWKDRKLLHKDLIFEMHYLGVTEYSFSLNFSRPSTHVIAQYYNFIRLGKEGYKDVMRSCLHNSRYLARALEHSGLFNVLSDVHRTKGNRGPESESSTKAHSLEDFNVGLSLVAFTVSPKFKKLVPGIDVADISGLIRTKGWLVPAYNLPKGEEQTRILRVVVKEGMSEELVDRLIRDIIAASNALITKGNNGIMAPVQTTSDEASNEGQAAKSVFEIMEEYSASNPFLGKENDTDESSAAKTHKVPSKSRTNSTFHSCC